MSWDENNKNCTMNHVYGIIEFIDKNNKKIRRNFKAWHKKVLISLIMTYWHVCVGYPFEPSTPKEKAICFSNMFVAH